MLDPITRASYEPVLSSIEKFLVVNLAVIGVKVSNNSYYHIHASSVVSITILNEYLDYQDWSSAANLIINRTHYSPEGIKLITSFKSGMNTYRTFFDWVHLGNLR